MLVKRFSPSAAGRGLASLDHVPLREQHIMRRGLLGIGRRRSYSKYLSLVDVIKMWERVPSFALTAFLLSASFSRIQNCSEQPNGDLTRVARPSFTGE